MEVSRKRYKYVGKERDEESGLYYYGARYYADWLARFVSMDPQFGDYPSLSPYNAMGNNPIKFIDKDGKKIWDPVLKEEVKVSYNTEGKVVFATSSGREVSQKFLEYSKPVIEAMSQTDIGRERIEFIQKIPTNVTVILSNKRLDIYSDAMGVTKGKGRIKDESGAKYYKKAELIVFLPMIKNPKTFYGGVGSKEDSAIKFMDVTEGIGMVGTHESGELEIKKVWEKGFLFFKKHDDRYPAGLEFKYREQYREKYGGSMKFKDMYQYEK
jgi:RHS repeat-associated protein